MFGQSRSELYSSNTSSPSRHQPVFLSQVPTEFSFDTENLVMSTENDPLAVFPSLSSSASSKVVCGVVPVKFAALVLFSLMHSECAERVFRAIW